MPLYEYECEACGKRFEKILKFSDAPLEVCEKCGKGPIKKLVSSPAIQFKGSGWYITDYAKKSSTDSGKKTGGSEASSDTKSTETKTETTTTTTSSDKKD